MSVSIPTILHALLRKMYHHNARPIEVVKRQCNSLVLFFLTNTSSSAPGCSLVGDSLFHLFITSLVCLSEFVMLERSTKVDQSAQLWF